MKRILFFAMAVVALASCGGADRKTLLPNVSGKAGEVIVVMEKPDWEGTLGSTTRDILACDCPYLPQKEPLYTLVNVVPSNFADLFKVHRNIVFVTVDPQTPKTGVSYRKDVWAATQCVIQVAAPDVERADSLLKADNKTITAFIEQAERDRVIRNSVLYEEKTVSDKVAEVFGGAPHIPTGYKLKKISNDFAWISDDKQYTMQGIFIYRYPASEEVDNFALETIIAKRNETMKANVPGMFENTYMTTGTFLPPYVEYLKYRGRDFAQTRGLWEVENDYMGGPFVSQTFYSQDGKDIIVTEAFVYAPKYDKRQYLRQTESILYSWEWADNESK